LRVLSLHFLCFRSADAASSILFGPSAILDSESFRIVVHKLTAVAVFRLRLAACTSTEYRTALVATE
jgi:hypothetical protein